MGVSLRAIIIGLVLIPFTVFWLVLSEIVWYSGQPTTISLFSHVIFLLTILLLLNLVLKRFWPKAAFSPGEFMVVYTMLAIASSLAGHDMIEILVPTLIHLDYGPNQPLYTGWSEHVPDWLRMTEESAGGLGRTAINSAYIGQESMYRAENLIPWLKPLGYWFLFIMALCAVMWGLILVFRKQWTENEKLAYPVIQVPMLLATQLKELLHSRPFWVAFGIAAFIGVFNGLHVLFPLFPEIPTVQILNLGTLMSERPWTAMGGAWVSFYPFAIGLAFFMPVDLAFSCWFFFVFWKVQRIMADYIGVQGMPGFPFVEEQTAGGYYALAVISVYVTRTHLARAARMLVKPPEDADPWERFEIRFAALLMFVGLAFLMWFCMAANMTWYLTAVFFFLYFMISIAITRMRAELGPPAHDLHNIGPHQQIVKFIGANRMNSLYPRDLVMYGFMNFFNRAYRGHPMPHGLEGFRIAERFKLSNSRYFIAMIIAIVAGTFCGFWAMVWSLNKYGAAAQILGPAEIFGTEPWANHVNVWFTAPQPHNWGPTWAIIIGLLFCLGLAAMRMAFTWWPFHPVGYAVSGSWSMEQLWLCIFVAWLIKVLLLKYGGAKAYKPFVPFFVGLIMGDLMVGSFWNIFGIVTEQQVYHFWPY